MHDRIIVTRKAKTGRDTNCAYVDQCENEVQITQKKINDFNKNSRTETQTYVQKNYRRKKGMPLTYN